MGRSTSGYDIPESTGWVKGAMARISERINEVKGLAQAAARVAAHPDWGTIQNIPELRYRGTAAERDTVYGVPGTTAEKVALANAHAVWFNTELGWEEGYYVVDGTSGLTARGLVAGTADGWYPTGQGVTPKAIYRPTGTTTTAANTILGGWSADTWRNCDTSWFSYSSGQVTIGKAGRYRIRWSTTIQTGSGQVDCWFAVGSTFANDAWPLNNTLYDNMNFEFADVPVAAGEIAKCTNVSGVAQVHISSSTRRGEWVLEYLAPNLVGV